MRKTFFVKIVYLQIILCKEWTDLKCKHLFQFCADFQDTCVTSENREKAAVSGCNIQQKETLSVNKKITPATQNKRFPVIESFCAKLGLADANIQPELQSHRVHKLLVFLLWMEHMNMELVLRVIPSRWREWWMFRPWRLSQHEGST